MGKRIGGKPHVAGGDQKVTGQRRVHCYGVKTAWRVELTHHGTDHAFRWVEDRNLLVGWPINVCLAIIRAGRTRTADAQQDNPIANPHTVPASGQTVERLTPSRHQHQGGQEQQRRRLAE